jgi:hypothetical protein
MYTNRRRARPSVTDDSVMRDAATETRDLRVSVLCVGASRISLSHVVYCNTPVTSSDRARNQIYGPPTNNVLMPPLRSAINPNRLRWRRTSGRTWRRRGEALDRDACWARSTGCPFDEANQVDVVIVNNNNHCLFVASMRLTIGSIRDWKIKPK